MRFVLSLYVLLFVNSVYCQIFTVEKCYVISKQGISKTPKNFNFNAFASFLSQCKPSTEIIEKKLIGHIFVNLFINKNVLTETTLMYGINNLVDTCLVNYLKKTDISWIGAEMIDTSQRVVIGIRVDYRYCGIENVLKTNLSVFTNKNDLNIQSINQFKSVYNHYNAMYSFDSSSVSFYKQNISSNKFNNAVKHLSKLNWLNSDFKNNSILLDFDKNGRINTIVHQNDSVFIFEDNKLQFSERGVLRSIKRNKKEVLIELGAICTICNQYVYTTSFFKGKNGNYSELNNVTNYSKLTQLFDTITFTKTVKTNQKTYIRSNPLIINEPYNNCSGNITEENICVGLKVWGNIFGEIESGTQLFVINEFVDAYKKKWFWVIANKSDGLYLGWINESDVSNMIQN